MWDGGASVGVWDLLDGPSSLYPGCSRLLEGTTDSNCPSACVVPVGVVEVVSEAKYRGRKRGRGGIAV